MLWYVAVLKERTYDPVCPVLMQLVMNTILIHFNIILLFMWESWGGRIWSLVLQGPEPRMTVRTAGFLDCAGEGQEQFTWSDPPVYA
jgi:hypothetical protein